MKEPVQLWEQDGDTVYANSDERIDHVAIGRRRAPAWSGEWIHIPRAAIPALAEYLAGLCKEGDDA